MKLEIGMLIKSMVESPKVSKGTLQFVGTWQDLGRSGGYELKAINWQCSCCGRVSDDGQCCWKSKAKMYLEKLSSDIKEEFQKIYDDFDSKIKTEYVMDCGEEIEKYKYILQRMTIHKLLYH